MSTFVRILDDGSIYGYLTIEEFAKKFNVTEHSIRKAIERGYLHPLTIGKGPDRKHFFSEKYEYTVPKRGRPKKGG